MQKEIRMPSVAANATHAIINEWVVKEGDTVNCGDCLAMVETDKAVVELNAESSGVVAKLLFGQGDEVEVGAIIAMLAGTEDAVSEAGEALQDGIDVLASEPVPAAVLPDEAAQVAHESPAAPARVMASPIARKSAKLAGIDLSSLHGSGPDGRIVRADVMRASGATSVEALPGRAAGSTYRAVPHTNMRRVIARRLCESKAAVPHFYLSQTFSVDRLLSLRNEANLHHAGQKRLSVNDFIIKAVALALRDVPQANVRWTEEAMHQFDHADVSVAVSTESGLITPVVRAADTKTISEIGSEMAGLVERARAGALKAEEFQGGSFGISNMGMYGVEQFVAIINPPQAGILAVGAVRQAPVVRDGELIVANVLSATLSADHRAMDGAVAAQWMRRLHHYLDHPMSMLV